ncbi:MAG: IS21 family transposase [Dehalococcoidia bacterium]|jgi:transposase|nr:IS21 family transposase [Dehalococcoidia bacterium]
MIDPIKEQVIREMDKQGIKKRLIARQLNVSRNTVDKVLKTQAARPSIRKSGYDQHIEQVRELFGECQCNVVRVQEELAARYGIAIPYQSLTWLIRKYQLRTPAPKRAGRYYFKPGEEMQHDTSPHRLKLGNRLLTAQCAALSLAYSRQLFIQYYPRFTRFECKTFLTEALAYMQGACGRCVIDNTSVIVSHGTGPDAGFAPEMEAFARIYGVQFMAHRLNDPNRKARIERPFDYVERNFLAGRTFSDWRDLNHQARQWCEQVANRKPKRSLGMSPMEAWIMEKPSMHPLPKVLPPVYLAEQRTVDIEGYVHLDTIRYSVPDTLIGKTVEVLKYWQRVVIYHGRDIVAEHERELSGRDKRITKPGHHRPLNRKKAHQGSSMEEQTLTGQHETLDRYVADIKKQARGRGIVKLRRLLDLKRTYPAAPFLKAVEEALHYGLYDLARLEKMILKKTGGDFFELK